MLKQIPVLLLGDRAKVEKVHEGNRFGPHGDDISHNATDSGRSPVKGIHITGVIMGFHANCKCDIV
ncbi:hypothetical protein MKMG_01832 [Methanogenium sp. MK-MG]|nr:hypothetical protein MKMG_01832 [Methanogenium sp. MK-MG]